MIKILPTGTSAIVKHGLKTVRSNKARGRLGDGAKEHTFETGPVTIHAVWKDNKLEASLKIDSELYIRSITLDFRFRSPRHSGDTTLWVEAYKDAFKTGKVGTVPGVFSQKTNRAGAFALWIAEAPDSDGLFFRQSPPGEYPLRFHCKPLSRVLKVTWELNRLFDEGESLKLPEMGISRGRMDKLLPSWHREWERASRRELLQDRRTGWCGGKELQAPKDLREILSSIKSRKIKVDWFSVGPKYASEFGDWLLPSEAFKDRMGSLSRTIGEQSMAPGLRFAPLLLSRKSVLAEENPGWMVKTVNGPPVTVPGYCGEKEALYVLDVTREDVIKHLKRTFSIMRDQWGFRTYYLERMNAASVPGIRENNRISESSLLKTTAETIRETLGNKVLIIAGGLPRITTSDIWDARVITPELKRQNLMSVTSALLHSSIWNESTWINASGMLPLHIFNQDCNLSTQSLKTAVILSSGMVTFSGDPRTMDNSIGDSIINFLELFHKCRKGKLSIVPDIGGGSIRPLVVRNSTGWVGLFNFSNRKKEVRLARDDMKTTLGVSTALSAGDSTIFNSPEIHVALPPMGFRLFRG